MSQETAVIKSCTGCKDTPASRWQDQEYGKHQRVHNLTKSKAETKTYRCTVCGQVRT